MVHQLRSIGMRLQHVRFVGEGETGITVNVLPRMALHASIATVIARESATACAAVAWPISAALAVRRAPAADVASMACRISRSSIPVA